MKRAISLLCVFLLLLTLAPAAFAETVTINGNVISVMDDGTGQNVDDNDLKKTVTLTNRNIAYNGECGPLKYEIQSIQIAKINALGDTARFLGLEPGKDAALIGIQMFVENTSTEDITWYPYMSTIITSDKEQVDSDWIMSDSVGGTFMGKVIKQGQIYFICKITDAETLSHVTWRIDSPHDSELNHFGEDIVIEFDFPRGSGSNS